MNSYIRIKNICLSYTILSNVMSLFLCINFSISYGMQEKQPEAKDIIVSQIFPKDVIIKLFACADLATKQLLRQTCTTLYALEIKDILLHSPLIISKKDHLYHMVRTAQVNDAVTFTNLLCNASNCEHYNICDTVSYFFLHDSDALHILEEYKHNQNAMLFAKLLPHVMAVYKGGPEILYQFVTKHCKPENRNIDFVLHVAISRKYSNAVSELFLLQNPSLLNAKARGMTPLFVALLNNNIVMAKLLLSFEEVEPGIPNEDGLTPLAVAAHEGLTDIISLIRNHKKEYQEDPTVTIDATPWYNAICSGHVDIVRMLLEPINFEVPYETKPLHVAVVQDQLAVLEMLLNYSATDINSQNEHGNTALHLATSNDFLPIVKYLLNKGAEINMINKYGQTPLFCASLEGHAQVAELLLDHKADSDIASKKGSTPLDIAIRGNHVPIAHMLIKHGANPNVVVRSDCVSILMIAVVNNNYEAVELLIKHDAQVNATDVNGYTALIVAAKYGYYDIVQLLLTHKANINYKTNKKKSALSWAIINQHEPVVTLLLSQPGLLLDKKEEEYLKRFFNGTA